MSTQFLDTESEVELKPRTKANDFTRSQPGEFPECNGSVNPVNPDF